ncbi:MAG: hypothetical protein MUP81_05510 [Dehalococcoidia bacterium]|nr:hypothetical protein [Dehalococcoidia bacterium]
MKKETCWNCGLDLIVGEVIHNDGGGDSILCKCGASNTALSTIPSEPIKKTVSAKKAPPALKLKKVKTHAK